MLRNLAFILVCVLQLLVNVLVATFAPSTGILLYTALEYPREKLAPLPPAAAPMNDLREAYPAT